jgi:hypothetical protein
MAHSRALGTAERGNARIHALLYKADHPRRVDIYIDFFGDGAARPAAAHWSDWALRYSA